MGFYNYSYDICAMIILLVIMMMHGRQKKVVLLQNRLFSCLVCVAFITTVADLIDSLTTNNAENMPFWLLNATSYVYFCGITLVALLFALYSLSLRDNRIIKNQAVLILGLCLPLIVVAAMLATNPLNHLIFNYGKYKVYHRGDGLVFIYVTCFFYVAFGSFYALHNKRTITKSVRVSIYSFLIFACGASLVQMYFKDQVITCFALSICLLLLYANIQKPDSLTDPIVGILNKNCFSKMFEVSVRTKSKSYTMIMCLEDIPIVNAAIGMEKMNEILADIGAFLESFGNIQAYYLNSGTFVVLAEAESVIQSVQEEVSRRFDEKWEIGDLSVNMSVRTLSVCIPDDASTYDSFYNYIEYLRGLDNTHHWNLSATELHLDNSKRKAVVEKRIVEAIDNDGFQMFYQPIVSSETGKVVSAEALIRLYTDDYGFIPPDEFIPLAEKNGLILKIGDMVFKKVFEFMSKNRLVEKGVECIDVNLSVVQCMQEDLSGKLIQMLKGFGIDHSQIIMEITETAAANSPRMLLQNMNELWKHDIHFSLDDFGSGYSNMSYIMDLPFKVIKFDKHFINMATTTDKGRLLLESTVEMMKKLNLKMVAEGIETEEQCNMMKNMGIDFLQGYYFSKPIPGIEFIHFVNRFNGNV